MKKKNIIIITLFMLMFIMLFFGFLGLEFAKDKSWSINRHDKQDINGKIINAAVYSIIILVGSIFIYRKSIIKN